MWFRKKAIVVNVVDTKDLPEKDEHKEADDIASFGAHAYILVNNILYGTAILMGTYMAADTVRQCVIHTVTTRVK